jgi:hypothetical protein
MPIPKIKLMRGKLQQYMLFFRGCKHGFLWQRTLGDINHISGGFAFQVVQELLIDKVSAPWKLLPVCMLRNSL